MLQNFRFSAESSYRNHPRKKRPNKKKARAKYKAQKLARRINRK